MSNRRDITIPRPHVPYGPQGVPEGQADVNYLREAARTMEDFYKPFGSNLRATIVKLIRDSADAIDTARDAEQEGDTLPGCTGSEDCPAPAHQHGCFADLLGHCNDPEAHPYEEATE